jgi:hypothetical protein
MPRRLPVDETSMRQLPLAIVVMLAALAPATAARADAPAVFSPPQLLAGGGQDPVVAMGAGGDAVVAWSGLRGGVFVARRAAAGGPFTAPVQVAADQAENMSLRLARNDRGDLALAWTGTTPGPDGYPVAVMRFAFAPAGGPFGDAEDVPLAGRDPAVEDNVVGGLGVFGTRLALAADGTAVVAYMDTDRVADADRAVAAIRPPGGPFGAAQVLGRRVIAPPAVAADGLGHLYALWPATPPGAGAYTPRVAFVAEALPGAGFGAPVALSDPRLDASNGAALPQLAANRRGAVIAMWNGGRFGDLFPSRIDVALREPGRAWPAPQQIPTNGAGLVMRATVALNDRGDAVVAWPNQPFVMSSFRPAGGSFGAPAGGIGVGGSFEEMPMALDALGVTLVVRRVDDQFAPHIAAMLRRRDGAPERDVAISPRGTYVSSPAVATDPYGNGLVVWTTVGRSGGAVLSAAYSALAPAVSQLRVGSREFRLRVTEPARVRITVRRGTKGRSASQTAVVRATASKLAFATAVRRLLTHRGRYTATIRTRDAGPQAATTKIRFRRR